MSIRGTFKVLVFLLLGVCVNTFAGNIKKEWEIPFGRGESRISLTQDMFYWFDFEVSRGNLFLTDIDQKEVKIFDSTGKNVGVIKLSGIPEIMKIWDSVLVVLVQNRQLNIYNLQTKKLSIVDLGIEIKPYSYSAAFFSDSLLFIPKADRFISPGSDSYVMDISKLPTIEMALRKNAYDVRKEISWPDSMLEVGKNYSIQQMDFCFDSKDVLIICKYDKGHHGGKEEYFLFEKKNNKFVDLGYISGDQFGLVIHPNVCRGFKVYKDGIYFISERIEHHKEKGIIIAKIAIPK